MSRYSVLYDSGHPADPTPWAVIIDGDKEEVWDYHATEAEAAAEAKRMNSEDGVDVLWDKVSAAVDDLNGCYDEDTLSKLRKLAELLGIKA